VLKTVFTLLSISLTFSLVISNEQLDKFLIFFGKFGGANPIKMEYIYSLFW
jgi:hypothetical protein